LRLIPTCPFSLSLSFHEVSQLSVSFPFFHALGCQALLRRDRQSSQFLSPGPTDTALFFFFVFFRRQWGVHLPHSPLFRFPPGRAIRKLRTLTKTPQLPRPFNKTPSQKPYQKTQKNVKHLNKKKPDPPTASLQDQHFKTQLWDKKPNRIWEVTPDCPTLHLPPPTTQTKKFPPTHTQDKKIRVYPVTPGFTSHRNPPKSNGIFATSPRPRACSCLFITTCGLERKGVLSSSSTSFFCLLFAGPFVPLIYRSPLFSPFLFFWDRGLSFRSSSPPPFLLTLVPPLLHRQPG